MKKLLTGNITIIQEGIKMIRTGLEIVGKSKLNRWMSAISQAHLDHAEHKKRIAIKKVLREMRRAAK
jgi:hypothetical protein